MVTREVSNSFVVFNAAVVVGDKSEKWDISAATGGPVIFKHQLFAQV